MLFELLLLLLLVGEGYGAGREGKEDARSREKVRMKEKKEEKRRRGEKDILLGKKRRERVWRQKDRHGGVSALVRVYVCHNEGENEKVKASGLSRGTG